MGGSANIRNRAPFAVELPCANGCNAPDALGNPSAYVNSQGTHIVVYRGNDGHIWDLYWDTGAVMRQMGLMPSREPQ